MTQIVNTNMFVNASGHKRGVQLLTEPVDA